VLETSEKFLEIFQDYWIGVYKVNVRAIFFVIVIAIFNSHSQSRANESSSIVDFLKTADGKVS